MRWHGGTLIDAPFTASLDDGTLTVGAASLRVLSDAGSDIRAVGPDGAAFRLRKASFTVARYTAECDGRTYRANRTRGTRREILDADGRVVARTIGHLDGSLEVAVVDDTVPEIDLAFITWALTCVDTPGRRTKR